MENNSIGKPNDHLANERTFLAWLRTAMGIMGFGFVVVKFSMFTKQVSMIIDNKIPISQISYSGIIGVLLVAIGSLTAIMAFLNYKKIEKQLRSGTYTSSNPLITFLTSGIVLISVILIWYLTASI